VAQIRKNEQAFGFRGDRVDDSITSVKEGMWEDSALVALPANEAFPNNAASMVVFNFRVVAIELPKNQSAVAWFNVWRPSSWVKGRISIASSWAVSQDPVDPNANVVLSMVVRGFKMSPRTEPTETVTLFSSNDVVNLDGLVANDMVITEGNISTNEVTEDMDLISVAIQRDSQGGGLDTFPDSLFFLGAGMRYFATNKQ
jgi:hypothetical protein